MDTRQIKAVTFPAHGNLLPALDGRVASLGDNSAQRAKARPTLRSHGCGLPPRATPTRSAPRGWIAGSKAAEDTSLLALRSLGGIPSPVRWCGSGRCLRPSGTAYYGSGESFCGVRG